MSYLKKQAETIGTDNVLAWYDACSDSAPYWSIWYQKYLRFAWTNEDTEAGRAHLERMLQMLEESGVQDMYMIRLHHRTEKTGVLTDKSAYSASLFFRPLEYNAAGGQVTQYQPLQSAHGDQLLQTLNAINSRLTALEEGEEEPKESQPVGMAGQIGRLLENPVVQAKLMGVGEALLGKLLGVSIDPTPAPVMGTVAPAGDEQQAQAAIDRLRGTIPDIGAVLQKMADLAEIDPKPFQNQAEMLRKMNFNGNQ